MAFESNIFTKVDIQVYKNGGGGKTKVETFKKILSLSHNSRYIRTFQTQKCNNYYGTVS